MQFSFNERTNTLN